LPSPAAALQYRVTARPPKPSKLMQIFRSFGSLSMQQDVVPATPERLRQLIVQPAFWLILVLATLPLVFGTAQDNEVVITAFALFFSGIWALIFCFWIKGETIGWGWRIGTLLFTGIIGLAALDKFGELIRSPSGESSNSSFFAWFGYILAVGIPEELVKAFPVAALTLLLRKRLNAADIVILAVFSGLGFAAYENAGYFKNQIVACANGIDGYVSAASGTDKTAADAAASQVIASLVTTMLLPLVRSLSTTFAHAVFAGLSGVFIAKATRPEAVGRRIALCTLGLALAAAVHGTFDWLCNLQPVLPALIAGGGFLLLSVQMQALMPLPPATKTSTETPASAEPAGSFIAPEVADA